MRTASEVVLILVIDLVIISNLIIEIMITTRYDEEKRLKIALH